MTGGERGITGDGAVSTHNNVIPAKAGMTAQRGMTGYLPMLAKPSTNGARTTPRSVMKAATYRAGVTSKAGL